VRLSKKKAQMANRHSDTLFQLIKTLEKAEKRHFKLYIKRSSAKEDLKVIQLFDALDKMEEYDEKILFKKLPSLTKPQLANLKTHLYKEVLASLRLLKTSVNIDLQLSEHLDHARLLYNKGLKHQSLKILEKAKEQAKAHQKINTLVQLISLEKKIEILHITRSSTERTQALATEAMEVSDHIDRVTRLSSLALLLYRWYVIHGHARNEEDEKDIRQFFKENLPRNRQTISGFYERLYLYQSYCWYAFIRQDFLMYYRYAQKWVDLFEEFPVTKTVETGHYIKGVHTLLNAHFDLRNYRKFDETLAAFETYAITETANLYDNFKTHTSIYINGARVNGHLMKGSFAKGVELIPEIEEKLEEYSLYVDQHRILVFNYKIASLLVGNRQYEKAIDYLQKIINGPIDLRIDLQSYARLMHLICHYEMGNYELLESLVKAVHRFMLRMKNLTVVEEIMFRFLKKSYQSPQQIREALKDFLDQIKELEKNRFETRAFAYLDIISWVESKVHNKTMGEVIHAKYQKSRRK
jgi:tetratricopeptide (TPR) repeat protein